MVTAVSWTDRLRVERVIWTLDARMQRLPGRARRAIRRDLRTNLRAAASEVGTTGAVRQLGDLRQLAASYLEAESAPDPGPRHSWPAAAYWALAVAATLTALTLVGYTAFLAGLHATSAHLAGTYSWHTLRIFGIGGDVTFRHPGATGFGFTFSAPVLLYLAAAFILGGRLWRLPGAWWRHWRRHRAAGQH